jgi:hypothetical protein
MNQYAGYQYKKYDTSGLNHEALTSHRISIRFLIRPLMKTSYIQPSGMAAK